MQYKPAQGYSFFMGQRRDRQPASDIGTRAGVLFGCCTRSASLIGRYGMQSVPSRSIAQRRFLTAACPPLCTLFPQHELDQLERETLEVNGNSERLQRSHAELTELSILLDTAGHFFQSAQLMASRETGGSVPEVPSADVNAPLLGDREVRAVMCVLEGGGEA